LIELSAGGSFFACESYVVVTKVFITDAQIGMDECDPHGREWLC
jgi:hypothetical protein